MFLCALRPEKQLVAEEAKQNWSEMSAALFRGQAGSFWSADFGFLCRVILEVSKKVPLPPNALSSKRPNASGHFITLFDVHLE